MIVAALLHSSVFAQLFVFKTKLLPAKLCTFNRLLLRSTACWAAIEERLTGK